MSVIKRFWDEAGVLQEDGFYSIRLDGRAMKIPGGAPLRLTGRAMAEAIAAEWQAAGGEKGGTLTMEAVPLTRLAGTAQDRIAPDPGRVARELAKYAETDLLCYRAPHPAPLVARQAELWQPWLDWLALTHGARLEIAEGIMFKAQDPEALERVQAVMAGHGPDVLAALGIAIPSLGSAVLGLALAAGAIDAMTAHEAATLDERFEVEKWGDDPEAKARRDQAATDVALADRFIRLSGAG